MKRNRLGMLAAQFADSPATRPSSPIVRDASSDCTKGLLRALRFQDNRLRSIWRGRRGAHVAALSFAILAAFAGASCPLSFGQDSVKFIGSVSTVVSGLATVPIYDLPVGIAVDASGSVYFVSNDTVFKKNSTAAGSTTTTIGSNIGIPAGIAIDGSGNVYISDSEYGEVYKEAPSGASYTQSTIVTGLSTPEGIAVDGAGNLYIADFTNNRIVKETAGASGYSATSIAISGQAGPGPTAVAVDGSGNLFVIDSRGGLLKETLAGGVYTQSAISAQMQSVGEGDALCCGVSVAIDSSGNIYVASPVGGAVFKLTPAAGSYSISAIPSGPSGFSATGSNPPTSCCTPEGVAIDGNGNIYMIDTTTQGNVLKYSGAGGSFGTVDIGATVGPIDTFFQFSYASPTTDTAGGVASAVVSNQSPAVQDFSSPAAAATCASNTGPYGNLDFCYMPVSFSPKALGVRSATIVLTDTFNNVATGTLTGTGAAPQIGFLPANQAVLAIAPANGVVAPYAASVAVDSSGNLYVADSGDRLLLKDTLSAGSYTESIIPYTTTAGSGLGPGEVAVDAAGNLFVADAGTGIYKMSPSASGYTQTLVTQAAASSIAVDSNENVYFTGIANGGAYKETFASGSYTLSTLIPELTYGPAGIAVDSSGNVYIADLFTFTVIKETPSSGGYTASTLVTLPYKPVAIAIDALNNIYADVDSSSGSVIKLTPSGAGYVQSTLGANILCSNEYVSIAVDGGGNVYVPCGDLVEIGSAAVPSLQFAPTPTGSTSSDSPQTITVTNSGTGPLMFPAPGSGSNPSLSLNFALGTESTCPVLTTSSSIATLAAGATCVYSVSFSPTTTGSISGALVLTDNSLNATNPYATQSISLTATTVKTTPTVTVMPSLPTITTAQALTVPVAVNGGTGNPPPTGTVTLTGGGYTSAATTLSGGTATIDISAGSLSTGNDTLTVTYTPDSSSSSTYNSAAGSASVTVTATVSESFTLSALPTSVSVAPNGNVTSTISVTDVGGFTGTVALAATGLPNGVTASFAAGTAAGAQVLTLTATSTAASGGPVTVNITGTSGSLTSTTTVALTITSEASFGASGAGGSDAAVTVAPGATTGNTSTISIAGTNGYSGTVNLSCSISPAAASDPATCSLSPASVTLNGSTAQTSTLTVTTTASSSAENREKILLWPSAGGTALALVLLIGVPRGRRNWLAMLGLLLLFVSISAVGCGGGSSGGGGGGGGNAGTSAGTYTVTVTGTGTSSGSSSSVTATVGTVMLTVN